MLDPHIRQLLDTVFNAPPSAAPPDVAALRKAAEKSKRLGGLPEALASVIDAQVIDPQAIDGSRTTAVRIYRPEARSPLPLLLYAHGGGWVTGSLESHDRVCRMLANRLPAVVVAVDYRCAPEHVYPAALDDVDSAWRWARTNAAQLGADGTRFVVAGDSSGGNLAAALSFACALAMLRCPICSCCSIPPSTPRARAIHIASSIPGTTCRDRKWRGIGKSIAPAARSMRPSSRRSLRTIFPDCRPRSSPSPSATCCATTDSTTHAHWRPRAFRFASSTAAA